MTTEDPHTVEDAMEVFQKYDWLANCDRNGDGSWKMLYGPYAEPSEETLNDFWNDMDHLMEAEDLDHVTEIANGWIVVPDESS